MSTANTIPSSRLRIHLLGSFKVYIDGQSLPDNAIRGRKARTLLKLVGHQRLHQLIREQATDILWPDLEPEAANAQLYKALHHIRKSFGNFNPEAENWIEINDELIRLNPPGDGPITDMAMFEQSARTGLKEKRTEDLEKAYSIYCGDFLPMDRYEEWASVPREHLRQLFLDVLIALAGIYEEQGDLSEATEMLRQALDKEYSLESAHRGLMRVFAKKGQSTRALHQFDICREALRQELGMSPSHATKKILDDVLEGKIGEKTEQHSHRVSLYGPTIPIVGRAEECAVIDRHLNDLKNKSGGRLFISGEAGIGKTRLVQELIQRAYRKGLQFFMGKNTPAKMGKRAFGPFIGLLDDILKQRPDIEKRLPAELRVLLPGSSGHDLYFPHADKLAAKGYLFTQVYRFFKEISSEKPAVFILEDLHEADQGSRELLSYLLQHMGEIPALFVATYRKKEDRSFSEVIPVLQDNTTEIIDLAPLAYEDHVNLLHQHAEGDIIGADTVNHIYSLSEGYPLFALELLRHYKENRDARLSKQAKPMDPGSISPGLESIPASILQMVEQKLEKLSSPARHLLYIAAVIGRQVPYELLASIWNRDNKEGEHGLFNAIEEVIRAHLLEEHGLDYSFRHTLVQETIYLSVSDVQRQILHRQVAEQFMSQMERAEESPVELIAWHYLGARDMLKAAGFLLQAGRRAEKVFSHEDALKRYREAFDALEGMDGNEVTGLKCELLERIGDVYRACGQIEKSFDAYEQAISLAEDKVLDNRHLAELHRKVAVSAIMRTEIGRSEKYLEKAFALAGDDLRSQARLLITRALHLWHLNRLEEAYETAQKALGKAKKAGAESETTQVYEILAMTCLPMGRWDEGLKYEMERMARGWSPDIVVATDAHLCLWEYHVSGDQPIQKAKSFIEEISEKATHIGDLRCVAVCHYALGTMHLWRGNRRHAVEELSSSLELHERVGSPAGMAYSLARKSVLHTSMGAYELGWQAVTDGLSYARQASVRDHCLQRLFGVGIWNRLEANDSDEAGKLVDESEALLAECGACGACALELYPWLSYYYLKMNRIGKVQECGRAVSELAEKTGNPIGKAIAAMIKSSLSIAEKNRNQAKEQRISSYRMLEENVPVTAYSPVTHFLDRMVEQQAELVKQ